MAAADIVQLHWWNNPQNQQFLRGDWPDVRLAIWYHVAGDHAPQLITRELVDFADLNIPTNPWTFRELPVFGGLTPAERERRVQRLPAQALHPAATRGQGERAAGPLSQLLGERRRHARMRAAPA